MNEYKLKNALIQSFLSLIALFPVQVFSSLSARAVTSTDLDPSVFDPFDPREVFDLIRNVNDPEHPLTLEQLNVVELDKV